MLRMVVAVSCLGLAAACGEARDPAVGLAVRAEDGAVVGRVASIERDSEGRIVSADIPGLEPADAPHPAEDMLAQDERFWVRTSASAGAGGAFTASR